MMRLNRSQLYILLLAILTLLIAVITNVATSQLPESVKPHLWWAWPVLFSLAILFVIVSILSSKRDEPAVPTPEFSVKGYYAALRRRYQVLDLDALTPPQKEEYLQIHLRSVFVEQNVRENPPPIELPKEILEKLQHQGDIQFEDLPEGLTEEEIRAAGKKYYESAPKPVLDVLANSKNKLSVILGDPGSGKSTLMRYILLSLIEPEAESNLQQSFAGSLPLLIELRTFNALREEGKCDTFLEFLEYMGKTEGWYLTQTGLHQHLVDNKGVIILFDGLDEIFDATERERISHSIVGFASAYKNVRVILTSRIIGYKRRVFTDAGFAHLTLQDLDESQVSAFIKKWYELALANRPEDAESRQHRIMESFKSSASIRQLAGNPMLLTIMAIIGKHQELPHERWKLYDHAGGVLIEHWDVKRHLEKLNVDAPFIGEDDKKELLRRLAYRLQAGAGGLKGNHIHKDELQAEFDGYLRERFSLPSDRAATIAKSMIEQFRERNFILSLYGANVYGFVHRAFLEYFCAASFVYKFEKSRELTPEQLSKNVYGEHWKDESWHEVLRLIAGMIDERFSGKVIEYLSVEANKNWTSELPEKPPWNIALAVQCLVEVRNVTVLTSASRMLLEAIIELFSYATVKSALSYGLDSFIEQQILPSARVIGKDWPDRQKLPGILSKPNLFVKGIYAWLYAKGFADFVTAVGGGNDEVHNTLESYLSHQSPYHRALAPTALAKGWPDDPKTLEGVHKATADVSEDVRWVAIRALANNFPDDPQTTSILLEHARNDEDYVVRGMSLGRLADQFGTPQGLSLLRDRVVNDSEPIIRRSASELLAMHCQDDPGTLQLLLKVADEDSDDTVRKNAKELSAAMTANED